MKELTPQEKFDKFQAFSECKMFTIKYDGRSCSAIKYKCSSGRTYLLHQLPERQGEFLNENPYEDKYPYTWVVTGPSDVVCFDFIMKKITKNEINKL